MLLRRLRRAAKSKDELEPKDDAAGEENPDDQQYYYYYYYDLGEEPPETGGDTSTTAEPSEDKDNPIEKLTKDIAVKMKGESSTKRLFLRSPTSIFSPKNIIDLK